MILFDSHAHLDMIRGGPGSVRAALDRAWEAGLVGIVSVAGATRVSEYRDTLEIAEAEDRIRVAAGIHPHTARHATPSALDALRFALDHPSVVALGEIGLDYHYDHSPRPDQRRALARQIRMAHAARKPIVLHTREADRDTLDILADEGASELGGVVHCFSSGAELAEGAVEMGLFLSFSGILTFPGADEVREVARTAPLDRVMVETDSPFLSPVPHRGRPNEPARVRHVAEALAGVRGIEADESGRITAENACRCFGIPSSEMIRS